MKPRITFIEHNGSSHSVEARTGATAMQAAVDNLIPGIVGDCGGSCSCATCHAYVAPEWVERVGPAGEDEAEMLSGALDVRSNSRLACQIKISEELDGLVLLLPESQY
jgi:2Fe-2S ferredoxin